MKRIAYSLIAVCWASSASAIVNIENMRLGPSEPGFGGNIGLSISGRNGNTDKQEFSLDSRLQWHKDKNLDFLILSYDYGETNEIKNSNSSFLHGRHVSQFHPNRAWELFLQFETNEFTRLSYRGLLGTGLRFTLAEDSNRIGLYFGAGAFYVRETLEEITGLTDHGSEEFGRGNFYLSYKHKLNEQLTLLSTTYYQPRLDEGDDYRALEQAALAIKMTDSLDFKISLDIAHDSQPPQSVKKTDSRYLTGFNYRF